MVNYVFMEYSTAVKMNVPTAGESTDGSRAEEQQVVHINLPQCHGHLWHKGYSKALVTQSSASLLGSLASAPWTPDHADHRPLTTRHHPQPHPKCSQGTSEHPE